MLSYYFYMSPIPTLVNIVAKGSNTFSIRSPFNVTDLQEIVLMSHQLAAFHSQCQWTRIFLSLTTLVAMRTQLGFKWHQESHYTSQY